MDTNSISKIVSVLDLCSEIFKYPTKDFFKKVNYLGDLTDDEELKNFSLSQDLLESEHIRLFSVNATSNKTVPNASWWIDKKMMGKSFVSINDFYKECGFVVDLEVINLPQDHISLMCSFVAILLEEQQKEKALMFIDKYFMWLDKFEASLKEASSISLYPKTVSILKEQLNLLKRFT